MSMLGPLRLRQPGPHFIAVGANYDPGKFGPLMRAEKLAFGND